MKFSFIEEPQLEFGTGAHICPRAGITNFGVYDTRFENRREKLFVGAVGTNETLEKLGLWLEKCAAFIPGKPDAAQPNLFPAFCGFNKETGFKSKFIYNTGIARPLKNSAIDKILASTNRSRTIKSVVELYYKQIKFLAQNRTVDVIVCIIPNDLYDLISTEKKFRLEETLEDEKFSDDEFLDDEQIEEFKDEDAALESNFRRALKAKAMHLAVPLQLVREISFEPVVKEQQDEATKAWNFSTALYYKANRQTVPWKLHNDINKHSACFVGISFYRSRDRQTYLTSLAQVFDELGNGVILRGTPVEIDKRDRRPFLSEIQAYQLLKRALEEYVDAMNTVPGRLVLHKSSNFKEEEIRGFQMATDEMRVQSVDLITILDSDFRLFRTGIYPPYRGSHIEVDKKTHLLYTRGSVKFYRTQTSLYIPQPLEIRIVQSDESATTICREILSLTKMNWNNTQFDGKYPITLACSRKVGEVMKYLTEKDGTPQISYSYYM